MKTKMLAVAAALLMSVFSVVLYAQFHSKPSIPDVETASHFALADQNKDNSVSKEEFQHYLEVRQAAASVKNTYVRPVSNTTVKICPNSGQPCTDGGCEGGGCSNETGAVRMGGMSGCCKEMSGAMPAENCCQQTAAASPKADCDCGETCQCCDGCKTGDCTCEDCRCADCCNSKK